MIDLHTHTKYSDGTDDVITLLKKAQESKIEYLSITDHISINAYRDIENIDVKKYYTGEIINGCEFFANINGQSIELLGYNLDLKKLDIKMAQVYKYSLEKENEIETKRIIKRCKELGIKLNEENIKIDILIEFGTNSVHREFKKYPENEKFFKNKKAWESSYTFYRECVCNANSEFFINTNDLYPKVDEVIELIKQVDGLVFIPHIFVYGKNSMEYFEKITKTNKIDGIECYYSLFTDEQTKFLINYCKQNNLYISGGTDYHGKRKPDINLGIGKGNLDISYDVIKPWIENLKIK